MLTSALLTKKTYIKKIQQESPLSLRRINLHEAKKICYKNQISVLCYLKYHTGKIKVYTNFGNHMIVFLLIDKKNVLYLAPALI